MDVLVEEEDSPYVQESVQTTSWAEVLNPMIYLNYLVEFLANNGWLVLGSAALMVWLYHKAMPHYRRWRDAREEADYKKDPDKALARMEAIQRARELQQKKLEEASQRARELELERAAERAERRREELARLQGEGSGGRRLGSRDDEYLPLSAGDSTSYRAPKRSACGGGGCGR